MILWWRWMGKLQLRLLDHSMYIRRFIVVAIHIASVHVYINVYVHGGSDFGLFG